MSEQTLPYAIPTHTLPHSPGRAAFGVIVRTIGVLLILYGVQMLLVIVYQILGFNLQTFVSLSHLIEGVLALVLGVLLLRGNWLVRLAYGHHVD